MRPVPTIGSILAASGCVLIAAAICVKAGYVPISTGFARRLNGLGLSALIVGLAIDLSARRRERSKRDPREERQP